MTGPQAACGPLGLFMRLTNVLARLRQSVWSQAFSNKRLLTYVDK